MGSGRVTGATGDGRAISKKPSFEDEHWRHLASRARQGNEDLTKEDSEKLKNGLLKYWFLLDSDLLEVITKGDLRWADIAMARISYLVTAISNDFLGQCLEGDEETLCQLHRMLMNEGWWDRANNLDLGKTVWRREEEWERKMESQELDLRRYVFFHSELVHPNVLKMVDKGDKEGLRMAMNHVHYNSLRESRNITSLKTVVEGDKGRSGLKPQIATSMKVGGNLSYKGALFNKDGSKAADHVGGKEPDKRPGSHVEVLLKELDNSNIDDNIIEDLREIENYLVADKERKPSFNIGGEDSKCDDLDPNSIEDPNKAFPEELEEEGDYGSVDKEGVGIEDKEEVGINQDGEVDNEYINKNYDKDSIAPKSASDQLPSADAPLIIHSQNSSIVQPEKDDDDVIVPESSLEASSAFCQNFDVGNCDNPKIRGNKIWMVRDNDKSSEGGDTNLTPSGEVVIVSEAREVVHRSSCNSSSLVGKGFGKLNIGRKRGRPAKRKVGKINNPFEVKSAKCNVLRPDKGSEADRIYETCLLMGLEGQVPREETVKRIACRLSGN
ncbi:hypothetical protein ACET3Z_005303 [Daucus carota]